MMLMYVHDFPRFLPRTSSASTRERARLFGDSWNNSGSFDAVNGAEGCGDGNDEEAPDEKGRHCHVKSTKTY